MDILEPFLKQWEVAKQAPFVFIPALLILAVLIGIAEYALFGANLSRKDDLIATLKEQLAAAKETATKSVATALKPELRLSMSGGSVFVPDMDDVQNLRTGIAIDATVWNTGSPSVAISWSLVVIAQGRLPAVAQLTKMPDQMRASGTINSEVLRASDALDTKTKTDPIQGTPVTGKLLFYVPLEQSIVLAPSTVLELSVKDIYGTESVTRQKMGDWWHR